METRTTLLDSAEEMARSRGFDAFSFEDLATQIGIRKASVHYHFPTKAHLALDLMTRYRASFAAHLAQLAAQQGTAAQRLSSYLAMYQAALNGGSSVCVWPSRQGETALAQMFSVNWIGSIRTVLSGSQHNTP